MRLEPAEPDHERSRPMNKKILFPTDFSPASDAALAYAASLARDTGSQLLILHVEDVQVAYAGGEMYLPAPTTPNLEVEKMLRSVVLADKSVAYEHRLAIGSPAEEIVQIAKDEGVELIVMGTHGRSGLSRLLMGSVAEAVVRKATCPVLTLKQAAKAPLTKGKKRARAARS
jgi:nucleotide-binding universal stress UspA family protein